MTTLAQEVEYLEHRLAVVREWAEFTGRWTPGVAEGAGRAQAAREVLSILNGELPTILKTTEVKP